MRNQAFLACFIKMFIHVLVEPVNDNKSLYSLIDTI